MITRRTSKKVRTQLMKNEQATVCEPVKLSRSQRRLIERFVDGDSKPLFDVPSPEGAMISHKTVGSAQS